jgi:23S rRNA (guanosine2251-2'-O)-methyltransferase
MCGFVVLEGSICVVAALEANSRPIRSIYVAHDVPQRRLRPLLRAAAQRGQPVQRVPRTAVNTLAAGHTHGGILALAGPLRLVPLDTLLHRPPTTPPFLAVLDGLDDPYHLGQTIRALYAAGATGLLVDTRIWTNTTVTARASAGASERLPMAAVPDTPELLTRVRQAGIHLLCAERHHGNPIYLADLTRPLLLVIGGHRRGISRSWIDAADTRVSIPYGRHFTAALDVTSATAAIAFEIARQRATTPSTLPSRSPIGTNPACS